MRQTTADPSHQSLGKRNQPVCYTACSHDLTSQNKERYGHQGIDVHALDNLHGHRLEIDTNISACEQRCCHDCQENMYPGKQQQEKYS